MNQDKKLSSTKLCPVCGTRISESATRCLVCGTKLEQKVDTRKSTEIRAKRLPEITLSLPAALGLLALFLTLGAVLIFLVLNSGKGEDVSNLLPTDTPTVSPTVTETPTITLTSTPEATWTPLPPIEYPVKPGDSCPGIAAAFNVSVQSIILENNLSADCTLYEDTVLMIPQPTPTASPQPTATMSDVEKTEAACETVNYLVRADDTLSSIAATYNVLMETIREYNGLISDTVYEGQQLGIPLCMRKPTAGPTPTPTQMPPYPGPNLLLPADGASFSSATDIITLQWAAPGALEPNEAYAVVITDLTSADGFTKTEYVRDTSYIVPAAFVPNENKAHVFRWSVYIVRQIGDEDEEGRWEVAGNVSQERVFAWMGTSSNP